MIIHSLKDEMTRFTNNELEIEIEIEMIILSKFSHSQKQMQYVSVYFSCKGFLPVSAPTNKYPLFVILGSHKLP